MITQVKISDLKYQVEEIFDDSPSSATWINLLNILSAILSIVLIPILLVQVYFFAWDPSV